jgi:predicted nucleic acid-binding protein
VILADSSAWVEYDRATGSPPHLRLIEQIETGGPVAVTEPVVMEILASARDDRREADLRRLLGSFEMLGFDAVVDFDGAARIYRRCRVAGITPRGMLDCMIAAVAWRTGASLLAHDADMARVAQVIEIELDEASLTLDSV